MLRAVHRERYIVRHSSNGIPCGVCLSVSGSRYSTSGVATSKMKSIVRAENAMSRAKMKNAIASAELPLQRFFEIGNWMLRTQWRCPFAHRCGTLGVCERPGSGLTGEAPLPGARCDYSRWSMSHSLNIAFIKHATYQMHMLPSKWHIYFIK